jgi:trehalose/maltose hydrolase-like predicted phosphorylase
MLVFIILIIDTIQAKQDNITDLLTRADDLVTQQKSYNEVYEAMARSLGEAWKELNLQLEGRRNLLNQAIRYHTIAARVCLALHSENIHLFLIYLVY